MLNELSTAITFASFFNNFLSFPIELMQVTDSPLWLEIIAFSLTAFYAAISMTKSDRSPVAHIVASLLVFTDVVVAVILLFGMRWFRKHFDIRSPLIGWILAFLFAMNYAVAALFFATLTPDWPADGSVVDREQEL